MTGVQILGSSVFWYSGVTVAHPTSDWEDEVQFLGIPGAVGVKVASPLFMRKDLGSIPRVAR